MEKINHEFYMKKVLDLAKKGKGLVNPNPKVGAIIVKNGEIISEGYHKYYGGPHAEVYALKNAKKDIKGATLYVNLEPCSHYGKTPSCAVAVSKSGIKTVVIAMKDPNPKVSGKGIKILEDSGIEVINGIMEKESKRLNEVFIKHITTKEPFVLMKTASTLDGKIATKTGESKWITGEKSREKVHSVRNEYMGIMVGINTVLKDDPLLTTRIEKGRDPKVIVIDSKLKIPKECKILKTVNDRKIYIACTDKCNKEKKEYLKQIGVNIIELKGNKEERVPLKNLMKVLGEKGLDSILLEGGGTLNFSALKEKIVDKAMCFVAPKIIGGKESKAMIEGEGISHLKDVFTLSSCSVETIGEDILIEGYINK
ncbi:bifunctional diaminohydroxyphosphoribosylaminopyrimidine deaminase/5-amino-6-(5-phosphoribosylamino)uracil reductase RibD [Clostridium oceanicum]|uniref:Riboflavin biosynthesis protein RibD n=1 Tax=Clostridium oceanicum TaxID=1543 RepID=A0ABN1JUQ7_9CLOT